MEWKPKDIYHKEQIDNLELALKNPTSNHKVIKELIEEHKQKLKEMETLTI